MYALTELPVARGKKTSTIDSGELSLELQRSLAQLDFRHRKDRQIRRGKHLLLGPGMRRVVNRTESANDLPGCEHQWFGEMPCVARSPNRRSRYFENGIHYPSCLTVFDHAYRVTTFVGACPAASSPFVCSVIPVPQPKVSANPS